MNFHKYKYQAVAEFAFRVLLGLFFFLAGLGHALNFQMTQDGASILSTEYTAALAVAAVVALLVGGASLIVGFYTRVGAGLLVCFLVPATRIHALVMEIAVNSASILDTQASAQAKQTIETLRNIAVQGHQANIMKNLILLAVVLLYVVCGAGPLSLDGRKKRAKGRNVAVL